MTDIIATGPLVDFEAVSGYYNSVVTRALGIPAAFMIESTPSLTVQSEQRSVNRFLQRIEIERLKTMYPIFYIEERYVRGLNWRKAKRVARKRANAKKALARQLSAML